MIQIKLEEYLINCPKFWQNFIEYNSNRLDWSRRLLIKELYKVGATMNEEYVEFMNDSDATAFILKWS